MTQRASKTLAPDGIARGVEAAATAAIPFEDAALVQRCQKGDMRAFGVLVEKYQDRLLNTVLRLCGNGAEAEELAQEAFLKALERIRQFRGRSRFYTWLFRIAVNLTISHRRRAGRIRFHSMSDPEDEGGDRAGALTADVARRRQPGPEAAAISDETSRRVAEALEQLEDEFRSVVVLRDMEGMEYAEIAEVLDVPPGTVKSRLHRARATLREALADLMD